MALGVALSSSRTRHGGGGFTALSLKRWAIRSARCSKDASRITPPNRSSTLRAAREPASASARSGDAVSCDVGPDMQRQPALTGSAAAMRMRARTRFTPGCARTPGGPVRQDQRPDFTLNDYDIETIPLCWIDLPQPVARKDQAPGISLSPKRESAAHGDTAPP